jgi:branched-chain amino acid transport system ATP-binding protein
MPLLEVENLNAFYGDFHALFGLNLAVEEGGAVAVIGANGAGKSTLLRCLTGLIPRLSGSIRFQGEEIAGVRADRIARKGIALVPEGRGLFPSLNVEENLAMGRVVRREGPWTLEGVYELFPALKERRALPSTRLSGGQQQMVAIGRALLTNPRLLLCDEISLGLAPIVVGEIYACFQRIQEYGTAILLVEQDVSRALEAAGTVICLLEGKVSLAGPARGFSHADIAHAYFGGHA